MALQKDYETKEGYIANYWRITAVHLTAQNKADSFTLLVYKDKDSRDANKSPIGTAKHYTFPVYDENTAEIIMPSPFIFSQMDKTGINPYTIAYDWLKTLPEFSGALDV